MSRCIWIALLSIAAVSALEVIVLCAGSNGHALAALDAGRGEIYVGAYDVQNRRAACISEQVLTLPEFLAAAAGQQVVTSDPKLAEALRQAGAIVQSVLQPHADSVARLGFEKIQTGQTVTPEALDATYIRRSEAEIKLSTTRG